MKCLCAVVPREEGENTRLILSDSDNLRTDVHIASDDKFVYLPIISEDGLRYPVQEKELEEIDPPVNFKDLLDLPPGLMEQVPNSFDIVGDIFVLKLFPELEPYAKDIASTLLETNKNAKVVAIDRGVKGEFRTRDLEIVAGENRTNTIQKEYGMRYELDLAKVYFSPRLATERKRISDLVKQDEVIMDMFCGVGPFSILLASTGKPTAIFAIDKNPDAINYFIKNIKINKIKKISPMLGDARIRATQLPRPDRIIMNLPHTAIEFLDVAMGAVKKGGTIHLYTIQESETLDMIKNSIMSLAKSYGRKVSIENVQEVHTYSPSQQMFCFDIFVN